MLILLGGLILSLLIGGLPAFRHFGLGFIVSTDWDPVQQVFGAAVSIYGTLVTSVIALALAVPLAFGIAFYLTELAPTWLRRPVGTAIELLVADNGKGIGPDFLPSVFEAFCFEHGKLKVVTEGLL